MEKDIVIPQCRISPIQTIFNDVMQELLLKDKSNKRFPLSPSTVLNCKRQLQYDLCNYYKEGAIPRTDFSSRQLLIFEAGHQTEALLSKFLEKIPEFKVIEDKKRFTIYEDNTGLKLTGEMDRILVDERTGDKFLWDAKSINTFGFQEVKNTLTPKDRNYVQQQLYLHSDFIKAEGINKGILHYYNKDTSEDLMLEFDYNEEVALKALASMKQLWDEKGKVQPRTEIFGKSWPCKKPYCAYHDFCYGFLYGRYNSAIEILHQDSVLDNYKTLDKLDFIKYLFDKYGDSHLYYYGNQVFELSMLKTTIGIKVYDK